MEVIDMHVTNLQVVIMESRWDCSHTKVIKIKCLDIKPNYVFKLEDMFYENTFMTSSDRISLYANGYGLSVILIDKYLRSSLN